jgi:hypothetical protein
MISTPAQIESAMDSIALPGLDFTIVLPFKRQWFIPCGTSEEMATRVCSFFDVNLNKSLYNAYKTHDRDGFVSVVIEERVN